MNDAKKPSPDVIEPLVAESKSTYARQLWKTRFCRQGKFLFCSAYDASVQTWELDGERWIPLSGIQRHDGWLEAIAVSRTTNRLVTGDSWGRMIGWSYDESTGALTQQWFSISRRYSVVSEDGSRPGCANSLGRPRRAMGLQQAPGQKP